ncbi:MAG: glycosyltransferase family 9 protein [Bryobacteraceae bacterium]
MGDIIHTLPAVASLRLSFPGSRITWAIEPKWGPLLEGNPHIDRILPIQRSRPGSFVRTWSELRSIRPDIAIDFQGLLKSALVARAARPLELFGWATTFAREPLASRMYTRRVEPSSRHKVDQNIELVAAAGGAQVSHDIWIPPGQPEGALPETPYVLTHPFAGWQGKQWPLDRYEQLARQLENEGPTLVANVPPRRARELAGLSHVVVHTSSLGGLIDATRRAMAVLGLDSGPLHLAAALQKPGVALYGPTDPARNGPWGGSIRVLRSPDAATTYKRGRGANPCMQALTVDQVHQLLREALRTADSRA